MVKRIKKRIPKNKNEESVQGDSEVEVSEGVISAESDGSPVESPAALRDEIAANAQGASADRFSEVMEGLLLNLADNWLIVLLLMGVGLGLYGFVQYSDQAAKERLADNRVTIMKSFKQYETLDHASTRALKQKTSSSESNILGLSTGAASEIEPPPAKDYESVADQISKLKLSSKSAPIAKLTEASARFDAAKSADDFNKAAMLFSSVAKNQNVEPIAQSLAFRNAAIAYEEAASLSEDRAAWVTAAKAWKAFGDSDKAIFGLSADVNRARVLRASGDLEGARKAYQELKQAHNAALQDPKNQELNKRVKLGLALTASAKSEATAPAKTNAEGK